MGSNRDPSPKLPGDLVIWPCVFVNDPTETVKMRPTIILEGVDENTSGNVLMVPLSSTSWSDTEAIPIDMNSNNNLHMDCSAIPSGLFACDANRVLGKYTIGNVGSRVLDMLREVVSLRADNSKPTPPSISGGGINNVN